MGNASSSFFFSPDIELASRPLAEAWLEIRWQLEPGDQPEFMEDSAFPFALGAFYKSVKDQFGHREDLPASQAPPGMLPYIVRHQFRKGAEQWPVLQLGPGVATVNFTHPYSWPEFKDMSLYLRTKLVEAYSESELKPQSVSLQYRNAALFDYGSNNLLEFLKANLNTSLDLSPHIPGHAGATGIPVDGSIRLAFDLREPKGRGTLQLITGTKKNSKAIVFDLQVISKEDHAPDIYNEGEFESWLVSAHAVIHEWFFSLIEGPLLQKYVTERE